MVLISGQAGHQPYLSFGQVNPQKIHLNKKGAFNMFQRNGKSIQPGFCKHKTDHLSIGQVKFKIFF